MKPNQRRLSKTQHALVGLCVFIIGFLIVFCARLFVSVIQSQQDGVLIVLGAAVEVVLKLSLVLMPILFIRFVHREPLGSFGISWGETPFRHLLIGASTAVLWLILDFLALVLVFGSGVVAFGWRSDMVWGVWLFNFVYLLTLNSLGEEIESRGYLQTVFSRATGMRRGIMISAALFGASHIPINIYIYRSSLMTTLYHVVGAAIFGVVAGYLFVITGNILASISLHSVWNVTQTSLPLQINIPTDAPFVMYAQAALANAVILFIILALLTLLHRHKPNWLGKKRENRCR